jgi:hypothetical protein
LGFKMEQLTNLGTKEILNLCGDIYDHEARLFNKYKSMLKSIAGR